MSLNAVSANDEDQTSCTDSHQLHVPEPNYKPSELQQGEIRLVKVLPTVGDTIECSVWHAPQASSYTCLSYRCGEDRDGSNLIRVNGRPFTVLRNLWNFLDLARRELPNQPLWIDALSINQQNSWEKATQVSRMGSIYSTGTLTRIWLGTSGETEDLRAILERRDPNSNIDLITRLIGNNLYWTRVWIVQEVLLSVDRIIHIGDIAIEWELIYEYYHSIDLHCVSRAARYVDRHKSGNFLRSCAGRFLEQFFIAPYNFAGSNDRKLPVLLETYSQMECSLWQDRIFALLPLSVEKPTILIDYNTSRLDLFFETLRRCTKYRCLCWVKELASVLGLGPHDLNHSVSRKALMETFIEISLENDDTLPDSLCAPCSHRNCQFQDMDIISFDRMLSYELRDGVDRSVILSGRCTGARSCEACKDEKGSAFFSFELHRLLQKIDDDDVFIGVEVQTLLTAPMDQPPIRVLRLSQLAFLSILIHDKWRPWHSCLHYRLEPWDGSRPHYRGLNRRRQSLSPGTVSGISRNRSTDTLYVSVTV